ncbi:histone deacetylation protein Rxt3-domain-containing protein [Bisporella sp. PMI_857]|nr:histone deacetylation protein Rxt3-domain-containing protein [Bisporella sp. PMI_857]
MDPRQPPQHPFSRNVASPYTRNAPYASPSTQSSYPPSSHAPNPTPNPSAPYAEHQRRPSEPPYSSYGQRSYNGEGHLRDGPLREGPPRDGPVREGHTREGPMTGSMHGRHHSTSSVGHTPVTRGMPPPSSPQQSNTQHRFSHPPPTRTPVSTTPAAFGSSRDLPALGSATQSHRSGVSIADLLGGSSTSREPPSQHYPPTTSSTGHNPIYSGASTHASPRVTTAPDYAPFRRPTTPEHARTYEPRDHRANSAGSPPSLSTLYSPESRRYGTPQTYGQRAIPDDRRDGSVRIPGSQASIPPRPSSQPGSYNSLQRTVDPKQGPAHNEGLFGRPARSDSLNRDSFRNEYEERHNTELAYAEKARHERERREREQREQREQREIQEREQRELREQQKDQELQVIREQRKQREQLEQRDRLINEHRNLQELAHQRAQPLSRAPEPRQQPAWMRHGYEPPRPEYEPIPEQQPHQREPLHNFPRTTAASTYTGHSAYAPNEHRFPPVSQPTAAQAQHSANAISPYEAALQERQRAAQQQEQQRQAMYLGQSQNSIYQQESPTRRPLDDAQLQQQAQRSFLGVQEINRKGRISPLPQAVQGAQGQIGGPGGEPGIKSEFGRMFSGIGSGVGAMGISSPVTAGPQSLPNSGFRREELEGLQGQESPIENGVYNMARSSSRGGRRRKLKEEDGRNDDDSSTGRRTPSGNGRGKRHKAHHHTHRHTHGHHQHHHRIEQLDNTSSPSQSNSSPFKNVRGSAIASPPDTKAIPVLHHHHVPRHHHHHQATPSKPETPKNVIIPLPKITVRSKVVLDQVAHLPRRHLGHAYYQSSLKPVGMTMNTSRTKLGFASTPEPLPLFEGAENCTFTIRVPRIHLSDTSRREITSRKAVWGTDIYTDDSDVIAACIHQGWFQGQWPEDVDTDLLGLELDDGPPEFPKDYLTTPPRRGPMEVPKKRDLHVTVLILPKLEKYSSTTRFGIRSREWGAKHEGYQSEHDGLSFMIVSIRWLESVDLNAGRTIKETKRLKPIQLQEWEIEEERNWSNRVLGQSAANGATVVIEESFERGNGNGLLGDLTGIGGRSWWKKVQTRHATPPRNEKKEIQEITEKMMENANIPVKHSSTESGENPVNEKS